MSPSGVSICSVVRLILGLRKVPPLGLWRCKDLKRSQEGSESKSEAWRGRDLGRQGPRSLEDLVGHRDGQGAGEGVLLARVVAAEQPPAPDLDFGAVAELRPRAGRLLA